MSILGSIVQSSGGGGGVASSFEAGSLAQETIDRLEENIGLNSLRSAVEGGWTWFNMIDGVADVFTDETGVNTGSAVNAGYDASGDYYSPLSDKVLLVHADGADASTIFTDTSGTGKTLVTVGDAQVDTAQSKFGGASMLLDGSGDYAYTATSADFNYGSGNFTIDCWIRPSSVTGLQYIIGQYSAGDANNTGVTLMMSGTEIRYVWALDGVGSFTFADTTSAGLSIGVWAHIAYVRDGDTLTVYVDGVSRGTTSLAASQVLHSSTLTLAIGTSSNEGPAAHYSGHIDEIRISKGTATWTTGFTPPTSAYPAVTNMTLPSDAFTTLITPSSGRLVVLYVPIESITLNTDLIFECSRDGGTTWTSWTLEANSIFAGAVEILTTQDLDISAQPTGSLSIIWRATTANERNIRIHGVYLQWR
tara:strand:- start:296 stop:1552 length:1257 start_codon:yes stop_codon:yes gene_type:complete